VLTNGDYNFEAEDPIAKMGLGVTQMGLPAIVAGGTPTQFTIFYDAPGADPTADRSFVFEGNFDYLSGVPTGFIAKIAEFDGAAIPAARAEFLFGADLAPAQLWLPAAVAAAGGDESLIEALTASWNVVFSGMSGNDAFSSGDQQDSFIGGAGNDTFDGQGDIDRAGYTAATGPIEVQLAAGTVQGTGANNSSIGTDTLRSIEIVGGTEFDDIFIATGFSSQSVNAGSIIPLNLTGTFNQFEGLDGNDTVVGNDNTRISYAHAFGGVTVDFDVSVANGSNPLFPAGTVLGQASGTAPGDAAGVGTDTFSHVNRVIGSYYGDVLTGSNRTDGVLEFFEGRGGDDTIIGDGAAGTGGFDIASYSNDPADDFGNGIVVDLAAGVVTGGFYTGTDTLLRVEGVNGTEFDDTYDATGGDGPGGNPGFGELGALNIGDSGTFNTFDGGGGDDTVTGNGNTRVQYTNAAAGVTVTLGSGGGGTAFSTALNDRAGIGIDNFVSGVNAVRGSEFGDILAGNELANTLDGRGGNDVLNGGAANDSMTGGTGADIFVYGLASGSDRIQDFNRGEGDRIDLRAFSGINGIGDLTFQEGTAIPGGFTVGAGGPDTRIIGFGAGNSLQLIGVAAASFVASDFIFNGQVAITVQTLDGYNFGTLYDDLAGSIGAINIVDGSRFTATNGARGLVFDVRVSGATGDDPLTGTVNNIDIYDTDGNALVSTSGWAFTVASLTSAIAAYEPGNPATTTELDNIFNAATYSVVGSAGMQSFDGPSHTGADVFFGGDGADVFNGMAGPFGPFDRGNDTVDYSHATGPITANLSNPSANSGAAVGDIYISIENLRGSAGVDTLIGDGNNNVLEGGPGGDVLDGGNGIDTASYQHADAGVTANLTDPTEAGNSNTGDALDDSYTSIENLRGSQQADTLVGNGGDNVLEGGLGGDSLDGRGGSNTASYEHATAGVTANLSNPNDLVSPNTGEAAGDGYQSIQNLFGSRFNDQLIGDANANILNGGYGGNDTLTGNGGADTFVFRGSQETITDFSHGESDLIDISGFGLNDAEVQALIDAAAGDTIDFGNGNILTLTGVDVHTLITSAIDPNKDFIYA